jgi:hypothetical protein
MELIDEKKPMVKNLVQLSLLKQTKTLQIRAAEPKM